MDRRTDELIAQLAASAVPVRRLPPPATRALAWFGLAVTWTVVVALVMHPRADLAGVVRDPVFIFQTAASVVAALVAAVAAFATAVPGYSAWRRASLIALSTIWFLWFVGEATLAGVATPSAVAGSECLAWLLVFASVPLATMAVLLRRGAALTPGRTLACGALAAGALADIGTRVCHANVTEAHLVWHAVAVLVVVVIGAAAAPAVLRWRRAI